MRRKLLVLAALAATTLSATTLSATTLIVASEQSVSCWECTSCDANTGICTGCKQVACARGAGEEPLLD